MTTRSLLLRDPALLTESQWASVVNDTARLGGWRRYHTYLSKKSPRGFPDLVLVRPPRLLFVELKRDAKESKTTPEQDEWLADLRVVGAAVEEAASVGELYLDERDALGRGFGADRPSIEVYVWRPSDWDDVVETLTGRRPAAGEEQAA